MLKGTRQFLQEISAYLSFWPLIVAALAAVGVGGVIGAFTDALRPWAPASWMACALVALVAFLALVRLSASVYRSYVDSNIRKKFYADTAKFDPMKTRFDRERFRVIDLIHPFSNVIEDRQFENCEIIGPANIVLIATGKGMLNGNNFANCDAVSHMGDAKLNTAIIFKDCRFLNCQFYNVLLMMQEDVYDAANTAITGLNWINRKTDTQNLAMRAASPATAILPPPPSGTEAETQR